MLPLGKIFYKNSVIVADGSILLHLAYSVEVMFLDCRTVGTYAK